MSTTARGVFAIPPTPFTDDGALDEESLRSLVRDLAATYPSFAEDWIRRSLSRS